MLAFYEREFTLLRPAQSLHSVQACIHIYGAYAIKPYNARNIDTVLLHNANTAYTIRHAIDCRLPTNAAN